jgi:light-regulated signal transduction histidine kinase (bacteriophytochrome)
LRAPLRSIGGFSQAIIDDYSGKLDEEGNSLLKRIINATQRMSDLIDALLMLAKITRSELVVENTDISAIVSSVANDLLKMNQGRANVEFIVQPDLSVKGDHKLLRIAVENLLSNSWKFTQKRDKAVIEFGQTFINGANAFFVKDNGVGFDMEFANKLFGAFQRLHNREEFEGTGIGLATTKRIILRHKGTIWAESRLDEGTIFYFTIGT